MPSKRDILCYLSLQHGGGGLVDEVKGQMAPQGTAVCCLKDED